MDLRLLAEPLPRRFKSKVRHVVIDSPPTNHGLTGNGCRLHPNANGPLVPGNRNPGKLGRRCKPPASYPQDHLEKGTRR